MKVAPAGQRKCTSARQVETFHKGGADAAETVRQAESRDSIRTIEAWLEISHRRCVAAEVDAEVQRTLAERDTGTLTTPDTEFASGEVAS